ENISNTQEKTFASGYILDFDTCISNVNIENLCNWLTDYKVNDAIRIASENAKEFSNLLQMKKQSKNNNCINSLLSEPSETNTNNNQLANEVS
ncbi:8954_t:CDS:2, partial [Funneliformis geosporum]